MNAKFIRFLERVLAESERAINRSHCPIGYSRNPDDDNYWSSKRASDARFDALQRVYIVRDMLRTARSLAQSAERPAPETCRYYVTAIDDSARIAYLAGPFEQHRDALDVVNDAKRVACEIDPWLRFASFGTSWADPNVVGDGKLNGRL